MLRVNNFGRNVVTLCDTQKSHHKINEKLEIIRNLGKAPEQMIMN